MKQSQRRLPKEYRGMSKALMLKIANNINNARRANVTTQTVSRLEEYQRRIT